MASVNSAVSSLKVNTDIWELLLAGGVKYFTERALSKYIGNGTLKSGLIKLAVPMGAEFLVPANFRNNAFYKIGKTALVIDGAEDIIKYTMDRLGKGSSNGQDASFSVI